MAAAAHRPIVCAGIAMLCGSLLAAADPLRLVVCAPGYPGTTETAQPTMDGLAAAAAGAAGWKPGRLTAEYHPKLEEGLASLERDDAALALVSLPFYLEYRERLALSPLLQVAPAAGDSEQFTLVARKGAVTDSGSLAGYQLHGLHGYAPGFVRWVLADWGPLPDDVEIRFTARVVGSLRKAAKGEPVAVLLDAAQSTALDKLPFAGDLEVIAQSKPVVASVLCRVGERLPAAQAKKIAAGLADLHARDAGREVLESIRMKRFHAVDIAALARAESAFDAAAGRSGP